MQFLTDHFNQQTPIVQMWVSLVLLGLAAFIARYIIAAILKKALRQVRALSTSHVVSIVLDDRILLRASQIAPSVIVQLGIHLVPNLPSTPAEVIRNVAFALTVFHLVRLVTTLLNVSLEKSQQHNPSGQAHSFKSTVQLVNIVLYAAAAIVIIAALIDRSPAIVLSGMGAMSAVLMLVFKDTILSFTAGVLISSNDMLRLGDWIEMPQAGADGDVIDIALHTVKVQNWDRTITTIPTWKIVSESYKNWRGMQQSGGRRIKRSLWIDATSVRFLTPQEIDQLDDIELIREYLNTKVQDVQATNAERQKSLGDLATIPANQRRLTNLGTFRAYTLAYLRSRSDIHANMTLMVRQMESSSNGIPMEIYCFTTTTAWAVYEGIQGDIFDHLIAVLPDLGLRLFQNPSGADMRAMLENSALDTTDPQK